MYLVVSNLLQFQLTQQLFKEDDGMLKNHFMEVAKATQKTKVFYKGKENQKEMKIHTLVQALGNL